MEPSVPATCPDCGLTYVPDDPEDISYHTTHHAEITLPDNPTPDPMVARLADRSSGVIIVERNHPDYLHEKLYGIARRFKREMSYDQAGWAPKGSQLNPGATGALFSDHEGRALGGAGIYTQTPYPDVSHMIGWIWIAPNYRRTGVLARAIPDLAARFPGALIQFPYSEAMERFAAESNFICRDGGPLFLKRASS